jgi:hypothetical protein
VSPIDEFPDNARIVEVASGAGERVSGEVHERHSGSGSGEPASDCQLDPRRCTCHQG